MTKWIGQWSQSPETWILFLAPLLICCAILGKLQPVCLHFPTTNNRQK